MQEKSRYWVVMSLFCLHFICFGNLTALFFKPTAVHAVLNPFTAELFFKAWHASGNLVLQINLTVKYLETIYENVPHALRNSATYHN